MPVDTYLLLWLQALLGLHDCWAEAGYHEGSWWVALSDWLKARSAADVAPPSMGRGRYKPLCDAPGTYVMQA